MYIIKATPTAPPTWTYTFLYFFSILSQCQCRCQSEGVLRDAVRVTLHARPPLHWRSETSLIATGKSRRLWSRDKRVEWFICRRHTDASASSRTASVGVPCRIPGWSFVRRRPFCFGFAKQKPSVIDRRSSFVRKHDQLLAARRRRRIRCQPADWYC